MTDETRTETTLHHVVRTTSTQWEARRLLATGAAKLGDVVLADEQTAGRGRFGRTWISPAGGLYATILQPMDPLISLKAGLAVVYLLRSVGIQAGLKWPNDVLVADLKIAGVLVETEEEVSLVGIGMNLTSAPLASATYVAQTCDVPDRAAWAVTLAATLNGWQDDGFSLEAYRRVCLTLGSTVRIEGAGAAAPTVNGVARLIDDAGRLHVETEEGVVAVSSGECLHLRPAERSPVDPDVERG